MSTPVQKYFIKRLNLLAIVSALLLGVLLVQSQRIILLSDLENKGESLARILASVALDAAMTHDYATMERYVADIVVDPSITAVEVRRADDELLASAGKMDTGSGDLVVKKPITIGSDAFGTISITFSTKRIDDISRYLILATLAAIILFHLLGIFLSNLALKKTVITPLLVLNQAIEQFRRGNLQETITLSEPAEFVRIGQSFNTMAATIGRNFEDIKKKQAQLELEQNKLAAIVGSIADGLFVTDNHGVILSFNHAATEISGFTEQEAIGRKCSDLFQSTLCRDACALNHQGETIHNKETFIRTKEGRKLVVSVSSALLYDTDDQAVGGVQTFRDISDEKRRQEMYCHTEKLAAIGQLAAGVAHEINNPLSNIIGYASMIRPEKGEDDIEKRVAVIVEQARKCSDIVSGLLNYSRSSQAEPSRFSLEPHIEKIIGIIGYQSGKKGINISVPESGEHFVYADIGNIEQVMLNLLLNALQTDPHPRNIWVETGRAGNSSYFSIADDGPGIPPEDIPRIFDPFFTTKPVGQGTGLGLSICAGIVAEAGGSIDVQSRPEGGAIFTVLLPEDEESYETAIG